MKKYVKVRLKYAQKGTNINEVSFKEGRTIDI